MQLKESEGHIGVYLKKCTISGSMVPCDRNGTVLQGVQYVEYSAGIDEIDTAIIRLHICGVLDG